VRAWSESREDKGECMEWARNFGENSGQMEGAGR
jgi:hypothetical protein